MKSYEKTGVISVDDLDLPNEEELKKGVAIIECVQNIPCNPCVEACPFGAISMKDLNSTPIVDYSKCRGCKKCIAVCPGLAIFVVKILDNYAMISLPYEMLPVPKVGDKVHALDREGKVVGKAEVVHVGTERKTHVITIKVDRKLAMEVRNICPIKA